MEGKALVYDNIQIQYVWWGLNVDQHTFSYVVLIGDYLC